MTKVQVRYELTRPLDENLMDRIARVHGVYGIERVIILPDDGKIVVEYDATRLNPREVESVLHRNGIPVQLSV